MSAQPPRGSRGQAAVPPPGPPDDLEGLQQSDGGDGRAPRVLEMGRGAEPRADRTLVVQLIDGSPAGQDRMQGPCSVRHRRAGAPLDCPAPLASQTQRDSGPPPAGDLDSRGACPSSAPFLARGPGPRGRWRGFGTRTGSAHESNTRIGRKDGGGRNSAGDGRRSQALGASHRRSHRSRTDHSLRLACQRIARNGFRHRSSRRAVGAVRRGQKPVSRIRSRIRSGFRNGSCDGHPRVQPARGRVLARFPQSCCRPRSAGGRSPL